jgi:hypothetical protein
MINQKKMSTNIKQSESNYLTVNHKLTRKKFIFDGTASI